MFALLGSLIGFLSSALPSLIKLFQDHRDKQQELAIIKLQIEGKLVYSQDNLEVVKHQTNALTMSKLYDHSFEKTNTWVDSFAATVRPVITYAFFFMYIGLKVYVAMHTRDLSHVWSDQDEVIFATLMSFWFGNRVLNGKQYVYRNGK